MLSELLSTLANNVAVLANIFSMKSLLHNIGINSEGALSINERCVNNILSVIVVENPVGGSESRVCSPVGGAPSVIAEGLVAPVFPGVVAH